MTKKKYSPDLTRRRLLKTAAGAAAGGAALTGLDLVDDLDGPVGRASACGGICIGAAGAAAIALIGIGAGWTLRSWVFGGGNEIEKGLSTEMLMDSIYNQASAAAIGRSRFVTAMKSEYINRPKDQTPFANAAWQAVRFNVLEELANGGTVTSAESAARQALQRHRTRSIINVVERWNTGVSALVKAITLQEEHDLNILSLLSLPDVSTPDSSIYPVKKSTVDPGLGYEPVPSSEVSSGGYPIWRSSHGANLPVDPTDLSNRDKKLYVYGIGAKDEYGDKAIVTLAGNQDTTAERYYWKSPSIDHLGTYDRILSAYHGSYGRVDVLNTRIYRKSIEVIDSVVTSIKSDLTTYVDNLQSAWHQGAIDISDVYSSRDLVMKYSDSNKQSRLAAELLAMGRSIPSSEGFQAKISHPSLEVDSLWVDLYPSWTGEPISIKPGVTIPASAYSSAVIGFTSAATGNYRTKLLPGDSDLKIIDVKGVEGHADLDVKSGTVAGTNGRVVIYDGSSPPKLLANMNERSGSVVVKGSSTRSVHDLSEVKVHDGRYYLPSTKLSKGESVKKIRLIPAVKYNDPQLTVADPTKINSENLKQFMKNWDKYTDQIKSASSGGGSGVNLSMLESVGVPTKLLALAAVGGGGYLIYNDQK